MLSMKDYAEQKHISYEAVRKQVVRYKAELEGHIFKKNRTQYLDEYAVDFLDQKRATNPIVIYETNKDEELARLREENTDLLKKVANLQDLLLKEKQKVIPLEAKIETAEADKRLAIAEAVSEAEKRAEKEKKDALDEKTKELAEQAEIEKNKAREDAARIAAEEKDKEYAPVLQELDKAKKELDRPLTFWERLTGKRKVGD